MFDRTDVLWRDEPTPATADTSARDAGLTADQARQVTQRPGAPGQHPRSTDPDPDDQHTFDGEDRPRADTPEDRARERQARGRHRAWQDREAREGRPRVQRPSEERAEAYSHRHDSPEDAARDEQSRTAHLAGLDTQDRAREERAAQERDQLAAERQARIREARARLDSATPKPRPSAPVPDDRDQDRQARDDGRTGTTHRAWTDQDRAGIQRLTKDTPAPREPRQDRAKPDARTDGHRREYDAREAQPRDRRTRTDRDRDAIADVGMYRAVSYKDLSEQHYDNHPYVTRRAVTRMARAGLIEEHEATGPQGNTFKVLTPTQRGRDAAHRAADAAKRAAAAELGLPLQDNRVMYPDAQLEIEDRDGMGGRVNVEIASDHYHAAAIVAKAGAGFAMHGSSPSASRNIGRALGRAAARETDSGPGGGSGAGRDGSVEL